MNSRSDIQNPLKRVGGALIDEEIRVIGRIEKDTRRFFEGSGEMLLSDGSVAVKWQGKYIKLPLEQFGEEYNGYKKRVGMLFPRVF